MTAYKDLTREELLGLKKELELKAAGAKYCDCPACQAVEAILEKKKEMLK